MRQIILFSGGRTSGYMLHRLWPQIEKENTIVAFANTGKEMPQTLDFVHEAETRWSVPVVWLEYSRADARSIEPGIFPGKIRNSNLAKAAKNGDTVHWFKRVTYETAARNGQPFDELLNWMNVLPNVVARACSMQLKIRTVMRFLFSERIYEYAPTIGIRYDERQRSTEILSNCDSFEHPKFPLIEMGVTEADVLRFWSQNDFDLRLESFEGNCDLCFLKKKAKRVGMARRYPERIKWWMEWEDRHARGHIGHHEPKRTDKGGKKNGVVFRMNEPYSMIKELAESGVTCVGGTDIPCSCAERAFGKDYGV